MKKLVLSIVVVFALALLSSCRTGERCPAYSQQQSVENTADTNA